jgi:RimJ/RimL family protein N-acetyltransferase
MNAPVIETERLRLRMHRQDDFSACAAMWADPDVTKYIGGKPSTAQQTWSRLLAYIGHWQLLGFGYWAIETRDAHEFAGEIGFADFKRDIAASMQGAPEIGFALVSKFHGRGMATEAARAALSWSDQHFRSPRTVCLIDPQHAASQRVAEKCGYTIFDKGTYNDRPALFLERIALPHPDV